MNFECRHKVLGIFMACLAAAVMTAGCALFPPKPEVPMEPELVALARKAQQSVATVITYDLQRNVSGLGTGFFVDPSGHLVTNYHVVDGSYAADIRMSDGQLFPVDEVVSENRNGDLIKLHVQIPADSFQWVTVIGELPAIAEQVLVVGSPLGLEQTVSEGIVSAVRYLPPIGDIFQTSAPISPGSSGSPVINMKGNVIGVVSFQSIMGQNLNFAVSGKSVMELTPEKPGKPIFEWAFGNLQKTPKAAEELCKTGFDLVVQGEYKKALTYYLEAVEKDPGDLTAWYGLGYCYIGMDLPDKAIEAYGQAVRVQPDNAVAHYHLAKYYDSLGRHEEALAGYREVVRLEPENSIAHYDMGVAFEKLGHLEESMEAFGQSIRINPLYPAAHFRLAAVYGRLGQYAEAVASLEAVLRLQPENAPAFFSLGVLYGLLEKPEEEMEAYKQAIRIDPEFILPHFRLAVAYSKQGKRSLALEEYKIIKELDENAAGQLFEIIYRE